MMTSLRKKRERSHPINPKRFVGSFPQTKERGKNILFNNKIMNRRKVFLLFLLSTNAIGIGKYETKAIGLRSVRTLSHNNKNNRDLLNANLNSSTFNTTAGTNMNNMSNGAAQFATTFSPILFQEFYPNENQCYSAWGISMVLDLLVPGIIVTSSQHEYNALSSTKINGSICNEDDLVDELCDKIGLCINNNNIRTPDNGTVINELLWKATADRITTMYDGACLYSCDSDPLDEWNPPIYKPMIAIANSIWIDDDVALRNTYVNIVGETIVQQTNFHDINASTIVNQWVETQTMGLISNVLEDGPILADLVAINTIYFNAAWSIPFSEYATTENVFYTNTSRTEVVLDNAHFMHKNSIFEYSHDAIPGYQILQLEYRDSNLCMIVVLPTISTMSEASTTSTSLVSVNAIIGSLPSLTPQRVAVTLPKFRFEVEYDLKDPLISLGLELPFQDGAYCGILVDDGEGPCLFITDIIQNVAIHVMEKGTIASAATAAFLSRGGTFPTDAPNEFMADHPFQFVIYDSQEDLVLFEGLVVAPSAPDG